MSWLFLLFVVTPVVELWLLIRVGTQIGAASTIGLVLITGAVGAWMARREGFKALRSYQQAATRGELPAQAVVDGLAIFVGGALLMTPGILTDAVGFTLLFEPTRRLLARYLMRRLKDRVVMHTVEQSFRGGQGFAEGFPGDAPFTTSRPTGGHGDVYDATLEESASEDDDVGDSGEGR